MLKRVGFIYRNTDKEAFLHLWRRTRCELENGVLHINHSNSLCSLGTAYGGAKGPEHLSLDGAQVRGGRSCLLYIPALAAKVWGSFCL